MLADQLYDLGVPRTLANGFVAATAVPAPTQVSENGQGQSGGGGTVQGTYHTVDGGTITQAQLDALAQQSLAANPNASHGGYEGVGDTYNTPTSILDGGGSTGASTPKLDWSAYLANWGFPSDVVGKLDQIFSTYSDPNQASAAALAYIRGTDWYTQTFPGIQAGIKLGLFNDESGYRSYTNQLDQVYQRYYGRNVTGQEVNDALTQGHNANQIDAHFQGQAWVAANRNEVNYELGAFDKQGALNESDLGKLGDQMNGLDNMIGPQLQARVDAARQKMGRIFQGSLATPSLSLLNNGRVTTSGSAGTTPDIAS